VRSGSAQAEAAYLFVPAWLRMVSLRRPLFEEYDVIRPNGPIGKPWTTRYPIAAVSLATYESWVLNVGHVLGSV